MDSEGTSDMDMVIEKPEFHSVFSEGVDIFIGLYIIVVGVLSVSANIVVLCEGFKKKQEMTDMEIINVNIAICQIAPAIMSYPLVLMSAFSHGWYFSELDCQWNGFFIYFFAMTTIGSLLLMTFYRYLRMFHGHLFKKQNAPRVRLMMFLGLAASYLYGLLWALPPFLGYGSYILESHHLACSLDWTSLPLPYTMGILMFGYLFPISTMAGIYGRIIGTVRLSSRQISPFLNKAVKRDYHVTIVCILHCAFFLLVWTPYAVLSFMTMFSLPVSNNLYITSSFFAKVDTLVNPFVFFLINKTVVMHTKGIQKDKFTLPELNMKKYGHHKEVLMPIIHLGCAVSRV